MKIKRLQSFAVGFCLSSAIASAFVGSFGWAFIDLVLVGFNVWVGLERDEDIG